VASGASDHRPPIEVAAHAEPGQHADLFRLLIDRVVDYAIFLLTPEGVVASWNSGAQRVKYYAASEIVGQHFQRFYTERDRADGLPSRLLAIAKDEGRVENEGWRVRKDGSQFWADVVITALREEDGRLLGFAKVTRDLTERRRIEQERTRRLVAERAVERIERLQSATAALAATTRPRHAAEVLTDMAVGALGADGGALAFPLPDGTALEMVYARGHQAEDVENWPLSRPVFSITAHQSFAAARLAVDERLLGVLGISYDTPRELDAEERGFLLALAEVGAQAIDRAHVYESEQRARLQAEAAVHAQDEFLSIASHELRTPVAAVKATAQLAKRSIQRNQFEPTRTMRQMESIARAADRLAALVDDLLDVSRLRTGQLRLRREPLDLRSLVPEIVARHTATSVGHEFKVDLGDEPLQVFADPLRFEQVLDNLLSNAVKYSPDGGTIELLGQVEDGGVTMTVTDHGIGLPAGHEARIFETFGRAPNAAREQIPGLGLGLAICQQLVDSHAGRIWVTSPGEQQGTTFGVWLPAAADQS
jgi:PAS domain S-box-containing protein